jgi:DNA invertase Pin-like site-specific DNA recombinase
VIKIESVHIEEVRGIRKLHIDFGREKFAISGPNGSGKSGVIDAIEFGLTGQVLGAVAELERSLIVERVKAGLRNARAKGKRIGRPTSDVDASQVARLRASNVSWREIGRRLGMSARTARRALSGRGKTLAAHTAASAID